jgi:hypothetical protein
MKKTIIILLAIATVAALAFRTDNKPHCTYTMPCIIVGVDTLPEGLSVHLREAGEWQPLQSFPKKPKDTLWVYKIATN